MRTIAVLTPFLALTLLILGCSGVQTVSRDTDVQIETRIDTVYVPENVYTGVLVVRDTVYKDSVRVLHATGRISGGATADVTVYPDSGVVNVNVTTPPYVVEHEDTTTVTTNTEILQRVPSILERMRDVIYIALGIVAIFAVGYIIKSIRGK